MNNPLVETVEESDITHVDVLNTNDFIISDRYNGDVYEFKPNQRLTISLLAAEHMFALSMEEAARRNHVCRRYGWNRPDMMAGNLYLQYYNNLSITPARFRMVRVPPAPTYPAGEPLKRGPGRPPLAPKDRPADTMKSE